MVRVILKRLVGEYGRSRRYYLAQLQVILDLVDLHILEEEAEVLVREDIALGVIEEMRLDVSTRDKRDTS